MRQIILDTETTGLEAIQGHRIIEIGCVELVNRRPSGRTFQRYLNRRRHNRELADVAGDDCALQRFECRSLSSGYSAVRIRVKDRRVYGRKEGAIARKFNSALVRPMSPTLCAMELAAMLRRQAATVRFAVSGLSIAAGAFRKMPSALRCSPGTPRARERRDSRAVRR